MNHDGSSEDGQQQRRGVFDVDEDAALAALALAWGDAYEIYISAGQWQAWHRDAGDGDVLTGETPDALNRAIRADWARRGIRLPGPDVEELREVFFREYGGTL